MKAGMLRSSPNEIQRIVNGPEHYVVRKTRLPLNMPIYICMNKQKVNHQGFYSMDCKELGFNTPGDYSEDREYWYYYDKCHCDGKVIVKIEFDKVEEIPYQMGNVFPNNRYPYGYYSCPKQVLDGICMTNSQVTAYGKGKTIYAHHLSSVEIIKPRGIEEFISVSKVNQEWLNYKNAIEGFTPLSEYNFKTLVYLKKAPDDIMKNCMLTKAPLFYCYVEVDE